MGTLKQLEKRLAVDMALYGGNPSDMRSAQGSRTHSEISSSNQEFTGQMLGELRSDGEGGIQVIPNYKLREEEKETKDPAV